MSVCVGVVHSVCIVLQGGAGGCGGEGGGESLNPTHYYPFVYHFGLFIAVY